MTSDELIVDWRFHPGEAAELTVFDLIHHVIKCRVEIDKFETFDDFGLHEGLTPDVRQFALD